MEITFKEKEICELLEDYVKTKFGIADKEIKSHNKYNDYVVTVTNFPSDGETEG